MLKPAYPRLAQSLLALALSLGLDFQARAADPFEDVIRKTDPLTTDQERQAFHLLPGFEAQLVACEPDIGKPMNMAFDARGRLWVTQSREYPFPVLPVTKKGRDKISVLEDFAPDGHARKTHTFVEGLNIPIGLYPYQDGVIAFSIPKIHFFEDTNGDGHADKDTVLLSGFGYEKDTHGLTSNFRRGYDGWIYADHGFNNDSTLVARDGSTIKMNSGNCYRFRPDGMHVEQHSHGQVNPFGLMFDPLGDLWSADCHSSPTYILLHGGYYPSFGKPNDGLGFAPDICRHSHGSTAISGMIFYDDDQFPEQFRWNTFIGNVMTCRINRDSYVQHGSTRIAKEEPDFLSSDDPWFRPVAMELGPDGALYIADFYNRIIGHYEVPLDHPGRDRERGRIWRIVYTGKDVAKRKSQQFALGTASASKLITELRSPNITRRMLAMDQLVDRVGSSAIPPLTRLVRSAKASSTQKVHGLWALSRLGALQEDMLPPAAADSNAVVRVHAMHILAEQSHWSVAEAELARHATGDANPYVRRAAADALARHPMPQNIPVLLRLRHTTPSEDEQLVYVIRMALRNQLEGDHGFDAVTKRDLPDPDENAIADVAVAIKSQPAAAFLLNHLERYPVPHDKLQPILEHISRFTSEENLGRLKTFVLKIFSNDIDFQLTLFKSIQDGLGQRGVPLPLSFHEWGASLAEQLLATIPPDQMDWRSLPVSGLDSADPWFCQKRKSADGDDQSWFLSSLPPGGEKLTGILRSKSFLIPSKLNFYLAGHDGYPDKPLLKKNFIALRDADSNELLLTTSPPRNDTAQPITWDLTKFSGRRGYIELVDSDADPAFAWFAAGRFRPEVVNIPGLMPNTYEHRHEAGIELTGALKLTDLAPAISSLLLARDAGIETRRAAAKTLHTLSPVGAAEKLAAILKDPDEPDKLREACAQALADSASPSTMAILIEVLVTAPKSVQKQTALAMASHPESAGALLDALEKGKGSRRLLGDQTLHERLLATRGTATAKRIEALTADLPAEDQEREKLIKSRIASFARSSAAVNSGAALFKQNCSICHSLDGQGATIGPQLDGVGGRGAARLFEDILDPSRNVDPAFRVTLFTMKDGEVETGLFRREEGQTIVVADATGKERPLRKADVASRRQSQLSLMPDNFAQTLKPDELNELISFLLSKNSKTTAGR